MKRLGHREHPALAPHVLNELWMPGAGWPPQTRRARPRSSPARATPYFFGNVPALDIWVAFGYRNQYQGDGLTLDWIEGPGLGNTNLSVTNWIVTQTNDQAP